MMDNAMNHASILTWGWFNEGPSSNEEACPAYAACSAQARARDPTRFVTWADDTDLRGKCYGHATLISFNDYPGWCAYVCGGVPCRVRVSCLPASQLDRHCLYPLQVQPPR
eukprot:SAG11_NODE_985_length_6288_cov_53.468972_2_plen_111_part_00